MRVLELQNAGGTQATTFRDQCASLLPLLRFQGPNSGHPVAQAKYGYFEREYIPLGTNITQHFMKRQIKN